jgi:AAT family amino acid transporter
VSWTILPLFLLFEGTSFYTWLLSVSGFSGAICWISISWCQLRFRKRLLARGHRAEDLIFKAPGYPYLSWAAIGIQVLCLLVVALHPQLRSCLVIGVPAFVIPFVVTYVLDRKGKLTRGGDTGGERTFEELFPERHLSNPG